MTEHEHEQALKRQRADLRTAIASGLWRQAVKDTTEELGAEGVANIQRQAKDDPDTWWAPHHFVSGMRYRNWLRGRGYGEGQLGIDNLDNVYVRLLEEAAGVREPSAT